MIIRPGHPGHRRLRRGQQLTFLLFGLSLLATYEAGRLDSTKLWLLLLFFLDAMLLFLQLTLHQLNGRGGASLSSAAVPHQGVRFPLTLDELLSLDPGAFEDLVGVVMEAMGRGYTDVQRIGGSGDQGADLLMKNYFDLRVIVQCKRFAPDNLVGSPDMQRFLGSVVHYKAVYGWFVTSSAYTEPALGFAHANSERLRLLNGEQLLLLIHQRHDEMMRILQQRADTAVSVVSVIS